MFRQFTRSMRIFLLAVSFLWDYFSVKRAKRRYSGAALEQAEARVYARSGARVRRAALRLQGLIVKVGQFLSARSDVLPVAFTKELTQLQDAVPGVPFRIVRPTLERELGADLNAVFADFDTDPIAAASLGQVHRAILPGGEAVAVKVLRPGIERLAATDLNALKKVVRVLHRFTKFGRRMRILDIYEEFSRTVEEELDYRTEADHLKHFARLFREDSKIRVPHIHESFTSRRVMVMEFIDGVKITDVATLRAQNVDIRRVVDLLVDAYLKQLLQYGFVHLDPHPGNLFVLSDGSLCFLDFGMVAELPAREVSLFARLVRASLVQDLDTVVACMDDLGFLQPHADRSFLKRAVGVVLNRLNGIRLEKSNELEDFVEDFQTFLHDEPIIVHAKYMFLGRTIGMVAGVATELHPQIDWMRVLEDRALPMLNRIVESDHSGDGQASGWKRPILSLAERFFGERGRLVANIVLSQAEETATSTIRLPSSLGRLLNQIEHGDLQVRIDLNDAVHRLERQERLLVRAVWVLCACVTGVAGLWFQSHGSETQGDWSFGAAAVFAAAALWNTIRGLRQHRSERRLGHGRSSGRRRGFAAQPGEGGSRASAGSTERRRAGSESTGAGTAAKQSEAAYAEGPPDGQPGPRRPGRSS